MNSPASEFVVSRPESVGVAMRGSLQRFPVRRIYCVGRNYAEHVREMGGDEREPPFFFQKPTDALVPAGAQVHYPCFTNDFQHEVELVLAIGSEGAQVAKEKAAEYVYAVAVGIDLTRRDVQVAARKSGRPWETGKSFDHSAPCGDLVPLSGHLPERGRIELHVNDSVRQQGDLSQMIWSCAEIVAELSMQYRLFPGDLIYTGTPAGVGPLVPGDRVLARVQGLPDLRIDIVGRQE